jgi:hypothetical protein
MTSSQHAPYTLGDTRNTMAKTIRCDPAKASEPVKLVLSSDCRLQLACMKLDLIVIAGQHTAVNTFPGLVHTARHMLKARSGLSECSNLEI